MLRRPRFYVRKIPLGDPTTGIKGLLLIVYDEDLRDNAIITPAGEIITMPMRGRKTTEEELRELLREAMGATLIGEHAVGIAIQEGLVLPDAVVYLQDESGRRIPYAVFIRVRIPSGMRCRYRYLLYTFTKARLYIFSSMEFTSENARGATRMYPNAFIRSATSP